MFSFRPHEDPSQSSPKFIASIWKTFKTNTFRSYVLKTNKRVFWVHFPNAFIRIRVNSLRINNLVAFFFVQKSLNGRIYACGSIKFESYPLIIQAFSKNFLEINFLMVVYAMNVEKLSRSFHCARLLLNCVYMPYIDNWFFRSIHIA